LFGGTRDPDDLQAYTLLIGDRDEPIRTHDQHGSLVSTTVRRVPVLSAAQLAQLPAGRVVVIRRGMPPAIGTVRMAWQRRDVRLAARRLRRTECRGAAVAELRRLWYARDAVGAVARRSIRTARLVPPLEADLFHAALDRPVAVEKSLRCVTLLSLTPSGIIAGWRDFLNHRRPPMLMRFGAD
jgi:hypothetical protein